MSKFDNAGASKAFAEVEKQSGEMAQTVRLIPISTEDLIDNPNNSEDTSYTTDLELSIQELGFTDPLEVTDFGQPEGKYMILSGHRRREAGLKVGMTIFPCIIKHFDDETTVRNYALLANSHRDSTRDPLLYAYRYKLHEEYLKSSGFAGNIRQEVPKRLGLSLAQADRYNALNKIIRPVWELIREDKVGINSVQPLAPMGLEDQTKAYTIMVQALEDDVELTRPTVKKIVDACKNGARSWEDVKKTLQKGTELRDSGLPLNAFINTDPAGPRGESERTHDFNRTGEIRREFDPLAAEADLADADHERWLMDGNEAIKTPKTSRSSKKSEPNHDYEDDYDDEEYVRVGSEGEGAVIQSSERDADEVLEIVGKLARQLKVPHKYKSKDEGAQAITVYSGLIKVIVQQMQEISQAFDLDDEYADAQTKIEEMFR